MDHIVVFVQPFVAKQEVCVYKDGACVKSLKSNLNETGKICKELCEMYNIHQVDLGGNHIFAEKIKTNIAQNNFNDFNINVEIH